MTDHLIIGAGEVGTALAEVLRSTPTPDIHNDVTYLIDSDPRNTNVAWPPKPTESYAWGPDVLHIAFPYSPSFVDEVASYIYTWDPDLVIVHSTVPVGTCAKFDDSYDVVHSPVRGRHPGLAESIRTFVKHFGGPRADDAAHHFAIRGIETSVTHRSATTEAGKLWEMAQFAVNIAMEKEITHFCQWAGLDRDVVYAEFAAAYNEGYAKLDLDQFIRPILDHIPGPIGGHCVMPALDMLPDEYLSDWLKSWLANVAGPPPETSRITVDGKDIQEAASDSAQIIHGWLDAAHPEESRSPLEEVDPNLISQLKVMGDNWGPMGVARVAALLTDTALLVKNLNNTLGKDAQPEALKLPLHGGYSSACECETCRAFLEEYQKAEQRYHESGFRQSET